MASPRGHWFEQWLQYKKTATILTLHQHNHRINHTKSMMMNYTGAEWKFQHNKCYKHNHKARENIQSCWHAIEIYITNEDYGTRDAGI